MVHNLLLVQITRRGILLIMASLITYKLKYVTLKYVKWFDINVLLKHWKTSLNQYQTILSILVMNSGCSFSTFRTLHLQVKRK